MEVFSKYADMEVADEYAAALEFAITCSTCPNKIYGRASLYSNATCFLCKKQKQALYQQQNKIFYSILHHLKRVEEQFQKISSADHERVRKLAQEMCNRLYVHNFPIE